MTLTCPSYEASAAMCRATDTSGNAADENRPLLVIHLMTPGVIQIPGDVSVGEAARLMQEEEAPCVLIKDSETRIGIITPTDIVYKVVAQGLNPDDVEARRVMTRPVQFVEFDRPLEEVSTAMASAGAPLFIVTRHHQPIGVITAHDLVFSPKRYRSEIKGSVKVYNEKPEGVTHPILITQLSHLGAFVEGTAPMPPGSTVTLEFSLPGAKHPVAVEATVLSQGDTADMSNPRRSMPGGGVAVRFTDVSVSDQSQISAWIIRTRARKAGGA